MGARPAAWFALLPLLLAGAGSAGAGSFSVTPVRVEFDHDRRTAVMTLHNAEAVPLTLQASLVDWSQADGDDRYVATHDLLATPPVFTIAAGGEQIVRIALRREADPDREVSYRIFFEQVMEQASREFNGLNIALRIGVPIFLAPRAGAHGDLAWELHRQRDGQLQIDVVNHGTGHVQVTDFDADLGAEAGSVHVGVARYVLPGSRMSWTVAAPRQAGNATKARLHGFSDRGEFTAEAAITPPP